jgi:hypothetical protein
MVVLVVGWAVDVHAGGREALPFVPVARLDTSIVREPSGLARSTRHEGIFWTHSDSGNRAELYAIKADGQLVARVPVTNAPNLDWEDIAVSGGFIYVGDIGNNHGWLRVRVIYKFAEPDPFAKDVKTITPLARYSYRYPDNPFDAEALLARDQELFVIRKGAGKASVLYRLTPADGGHSRLTEVQIMRVGWISGADLSPDGRFLLAASERVVALIPINNDLTPRTDERVRVVSYPGGDQVEACCFDGGDALLLAENGRIYRITAAQIEREVRFIPSRGAAD